MALALWILGSRVGVGEGRGSLDLTEKGASKGPVSISSCSR